MQHRGWPDSVNPDLSIICNYTRLNCNSYYGKCSKISHFSLSVLNKMLVISPQIIKMLVRITNREDPDQTASSEAV